MRFLAALPSALEGLVPFQVVETALAAAIRGTEQGFPSMATATEISTSL